MCNDNQAELLPTNGTRASSTSAVVTRGTSAEVSTGTTASVQRGLTSTCTNLLVQLANSQISHSARCGQLQPKMCLDGTFPADFQSAKTIEDFEVMDGMYAHA